MRKICLLTFAAMFFSVVCFADTNQENPAQEKSQEAQPAQEGTIPGGMQGFVSLDLRDIDIVDALKFLSQKVNLDIVTTKSVAGKVTLMVENVPVQDVFDIMLRSNKLAYDKRGDIYNVMTEEEYRFLFGKFFSDAREVRTMRLAYTIPEQAFSLLDALKSDIGRVLVDPESGNILMMDIPDRIEKMLTSLEAFEHKNEVKIIPLQYAKAKDVEEALKSQLDAKRVGIIRSDDRANQVIVQTLPERMKDIERMVRELDKKTRQVLIETTIIKIKLTDEHLKGLQWEGLFDLSFKHKGLYAGSTPFSSVQSATSDFRSRKETKEDVGYVGSFPFSGTTSNTSSSVPTVGTDLLHVGIVGSQDADIILKYIQTLASTKVLANPKIVVINNQESRIHVGERQAYVTSTTTTGQSTSTVSENVTFVDVGIQFSITPVINEDGYVTMKVKTEISSVTSVLVTPTQNKIPIIDTSLAETTVMAKEGTTVVLGGLRRDERTSDYKQTPFLGRIPLLGEIFKSGSNKTDKTELMIMLTPKIITGDVLVTEAQGKNEQNGASGIKGRQDYNALRPQTKGLIVPAAGAQTPLDDKKVMFKGVRVVE